MKLYPDLHEEQKKLQSITNHTDKIHIRSAVLIDTTNEVGDTLRELEKDFGREDHEEIVKKLDKTTALIHQLTTTADGMWRELGQLLRTSKASYPAIC
jgi:predicted transcriptional regulator